MTRWRRAGAVAAAMASVAGVVVAGVGIGAGDAGGTSFRSSKSVVVVRSTDATQPAGSLPASRHVSADGSMRCPRAARACVDLRHRLAWLQVGGRVTYGPVPTGTAMKDHPTPRGLFRVAWKARHWVSTEYGIPMPWSVFFAAGGIAFHAGPLDLPSHGCVHLAPSAARRFFDGLAVGDRVDVR